MCSRTSHQGIQSSYGFHSLYTGEPNAVLKSPLRWYFILHLKKVQLLYFVFLRDTGCSYQFCFADYHDSAQIWTTSSPAHNRGGLTLLLNSHLMSQGSSSPANLKQCLQVCAGKETNTYCFQICLVINKRNKKISVSFQYSKIFLASSDRAVGMAGVFSVYPLQFFRSRALVVKNNVSQIWFSCV